MKQPDRTFVAALDPFMAARGFKFISSRYAYIRKTQSGFDDFSWSSYPLATGDKWEAGYYEGGYGMALRSDAIDALSSVVMPLYGGEKYQRYAITVYRGVGNPDGKWLAFDPDRDAGLCLRFDHLEEDVEKAVGRIEAMLEADGWAWYERYADPVALSRDINDPLDLRGGPHPLVNNSGHRPLIGVAAACVAEPERVGDLIDIYLTQVRADDVRFADERSQPLAPDLEKKLGMIVEKARELGYVVEAR